MGFPVGYVSSWAATGGGGGHPLGDPQYDNWVGAVSPPTNWSLDSGTPDYTARGVTVIGGQTALVYNIEPAEEQLYTGGKTIMFALDIETWTTDNLFVSLEMIDEGTVAGFVGEIDSVSAESTATAIRISTAAMYTYSNTPTAAAAPTGMAVLAVRDDGAGNLLVRLFGSNGDIVEDTTANVASDLGTFNDAQVKLRINMDTGDEVYVAYTYVNKSVALSDGDILAQATGWGWHPPLDMSPLVLETDWTIESLPTDWSPFGNEAWNTPVYAADGSYWDTTSTPTYGGSWTYTSPDAGVDGMQEFTIIQALDVTALTGGLYGASTMASVEHSPGISIDDFVSGFEFAAYDQDIVIPWTVAGQIYVAMTYAMDGTMSCYVFDDSGLTTDSGVGDAPVAEALNYFDTRNFTDTSSGFIKTTHTYFATNTVLDTAAITAIVTGWGWTP